jgi:hypothetical protein
MPDLGQKDSNAIRYEDQEVCAEATTPSPGGTVLRQLIRCASGGKREKWGWGPLINTDGAERGGQLPLGGGTTALATAGTSSSFLFSRQSTTREAWTGSSLPLC